MRAVCLAAVSIGASAIPESLLFGAPIEPDDAVLPSASIFSQKVSAAKRVHHCDLPKGRMIDLRRQ